MKEQINIEYHKWDRKKYKLLSKSLSNLLYLKEIQFYMPLFSLFFYIHNTPFSHKTIDLNRKYYLINLIKITKERYYNSNLFVKGMILDSSKNIIEEKEIFCKSIPILDPIHCINNNYNLRVKNNYHLPTGYNYNTFTKINDINNGAYIDTFCSFLFGQLVTSQKLPSFAIYYGSVNGIGEYNYDMTEEYDDFKIDKCFNDNLGKTFKLDIYLSDSEEGSSEEGSEEEGSERSLEGLSEGSEGSTGGKIKDNESGIKGEDDPYHSNDSSDCSDYSDPYCNDDYIAKIKDIPVQLLFIEKLEGTLEDYLLDSDFKEEVLLSCIFQISFALHYLQKIYQFTHNDLHINNIMYSTTDTEYIYYKINNKYFKVPTYGKIFKIIDFGRSILTFKNKVYMNDVFSRNGEAGGQYHYPHSVNFYKETQNEIINPNYNFDLCRLSMTIIEELDMDKISKGTEKFLYKMCEDKYGMNFCEMDDNFDLYISIAKNAINSLPSEILSHKIFKEYYVKKKHFPRKSYYSLN